MSSDTRNIKQQYVKHSDEKGRAYYLSSFCGEKRIIGQLTDEQIREHYRKQLVCGYGKEAIEELMRTEKKSREEILHILGKDKKEDKPMITEEQKAAMIADSANGMSYDKIAEKHGINVKTVQYHLTVARKSGLLPQSKYNPVKKKAAAESATPTEQDIPEVEQDVKTYLPKSCDRSEPVPERKAGKERRSVWFALADALKEFAENTLGAGTKVVAIYANDRTSECNIEVVTPDGKLLCFNVEEYKNLSYKPDDKESF